MKNKLFIICPFSHLEIPLQAEFGSDIYFLTYSGTIIHTEEHFYLQEVVNFIRKNKIEIIYIVNDLSCRFINSIIAENEVYELKSISVLKSIYYQHYSSQFKNNSFSNQIFKLSELNIKYQAETLIHHVITGKYIKENNIELRGILYSRHNKTSKELILQ